LKLSGRSIATAKLPAALKIEKSEWLIVVTGGRMWARNLFAHLRGKNLPPRTMFSNDPSNWMASPASLWCPTLRQAWPQKN